MKKLAVVLLGFTCIVGAFPAPAQNQNSPRPSGPQTDGPFRKVILDADKDVNGDGKIVDSLKDPMELAVAKDGRVFYVQRDGIVKMWRPDTKKTLVIGKLEVEEYGKTGMEDGLLGVRSEERRV